MCRQQALFSVLWLCPPLKDSEYLSPLGETPNQSVAAFTLRSHVSVAYTDPEP